jgi:CheY-like chemotaxis protein
MKILIVDDMAESIYMLETLLKAGGYEVVSAANGKEALKKLRSEGADMIISDILMPVMDGFRFCKEVKGDETLKDIPFVFYTSSYQDEKDEDLSFKMGAEKFIRKPIEPDAFIEIIQGVIGDIEKGKIEPKKPPLKEEKEIFNLYSERLVNKLEEKTLALERENTERKRAEERVKHLNLVLVAIRNVNQLIVHEKDTDRLLQGVCDNLIENRGYYNAWIALLDDAGRPVARAEAGLGKDFLPIVEGLKSGKMTDCVKKAQMQQEIVVTKDPPSTCTDCPLAKRYPGRAGFTARLEHDGKMYGLLTVSIPGDFAADEEEQSLFGEVAGDVGYALHNIEMEEEHKQAEEELAKHREHLEKLVRERTDELQKMVNLMAGREVRMAELKKVIEKLRAQLEEAEMTPVADDPLKEGGRLKSDF